MIAKKNIIPILLVIFLGIAVPIKMISQILYEMSPEGRYENYKEYIAESSELWVKNRDNQFYGKENIINWYETPDKDGMPPKDIYPPIIYENIKEAIELTFVEHYDIKDPDRMKRIISEHIESKKTSIIKELQ